MRWTRPEEGDVRFRTFFALLPVRIGLETRWLERVKVREVYKYFRYEMCSYWVMTDFITLDSEKPKGF